MTSRFLVALLIGAAMFLGLGTAARGGTIVTIGLDDGIADQAAGAAMLESHGMTGTFYVNSGRIGTSGYLSFSQLHVLEAAGHEIGGHTINHVNLPTLDADEQRRQICNDRSTLLAHGLDIRNFAYPFGADSPLTETIVTDCGYISARDSGGLGSCSGCTMAETLPPLDTYRLRSFSGLSPQTTLADLESDVMGAESSGQGWVQIVFHHLCDGCNSNAVSPSIFEQFLAWLEARSALGTVVRTVADVLAGNVNPAVAGPPPPPGSTTVRNPSFEEDVNLDGQADCWQRGGTGTNTATFTRVSDGHTGSWAEHVDVTSFTSGNRKIITYQDAGSCSISASSGRAYTVSGWYQGSGQVRIAAYYRSASGAWLTLGQGPLLPNSTAWASATWSTPPLPAGAEALSIGFIIQSTGSLTVDDVGLAAVDQLPPTVVLSTPLTGSVVSGHVGLSAAPSDVSGIASVEFLVNGSVVGSVSGAPYQVVWDSSVVADGVVSVVARAVDGAGNVGVSAPVSVAVRNGLVLGNPSLELDANVDGVADCWQHAVSGVNTALWTRSPDAHSGAVAERVEISSLTSGNRKLIVRQDSVCPPAVVAGRTYRVSGWYRSSQPVRVVVYYKSLAGAWKYWMQSPQIVASAAWAQAVWVTPPLPADAVALSPGLQLERVGWATMDDLDLTEVDTDPPVVLVSGPDGGSVVSGSVGLSAVAIDASPIARVEFLVNGSLVGSASGSPYQMVWDSSVVADGEVSVVARAVDGSGNVGVSAPVSVAVSNGLLLANWSLELDANADGVSDCWQHAVSGVNTAVWSRPSDAHSGAVAERVEISSLTSGNRKLIVRQDSVCPPAVVAGRTYRASGWYRSSQPVRVVVYYKSLAGAWKYWMQSPQIVASPAWAQAVWVTPPLPADAVALSPGLQLERVGWITIDDLTLAES